MKTRTKIIAFLFTLVFIPVLKGETVTINSMVPGDTLIVRTGPGLYDLASRWAAEYTAAYPGNRIMVSSDENITAVHGTGQALYIISGDQLKESDAASAWSMVVARDVIVPVINADNPCYKMMQERGVAAEKLGELLSRSGVVSWGDLFAEGGSYPIHLYSLNDETVSGLATAFLNTKSYPARGTMVEDPDRLVSAIQNDPLGIGFCRITDIIVPGDNEFITGLALMPIDINSNGVVDYFENIYSDFGTITRGVWIGKYPRSLYRNIYAVAGVENIGDKSSGFLKWVVTDGQRLLEESGYSELVMNERQSKLEKLTSIDVITASMDEGTGSRRSVYFLIGGIVLVLFVGGSYIFLTRSADPDEDIEYHARRRFIEESNMEAPRGIYYDKTHTWAFMEKDGQVKVGIDDFIQRITGPVTRVLIKNPGEVLKKGEKAMTIIQKGKQMVIYSPVSGTITAINDLLLIDSTAINRSPFNEGWVYEVEPDNWTWEIQQMNLSGWYRMWLKSELSRFKDFLSKVMALDSRQQLNPIMQDGGEVSENVLEDLDPRVWEEFQTSFLDPSK